MRKVWKAVLVILGVIAAGSVIVGIVDRKEQKKAEERARVEGREIHKPYGPYEKYFKRPLDFGLSLFALVVLAPVMLVVAIVDRVKLGSHIIYRQKRIGLNEREFEILKFRSMTEGRDEKGNLLPDELRLPPFGKKLRSTSLDELPSLVNILKGEMSIIGPRALPIRYIPFYTEEEHHRHDVRPGLSGLAQVNGRNYVSWENKFKMDLQYISKINFLDDWKLIFRTAAVVFKHDNIDTGSFIEKEGIVYQPLDVERGEKIHEN